MKSVSAPFGGTTSKKSSEPRRPGEGHARSSRGRDGAEVEAVRWARCDEVAPTEPPAAARRAPRRLEEPQTGVVRRMPVASAERQSALLERGPSRRTAAATGRGREPSAPPDPGQAKDWRCLEWGGPSKERRPKRNSKVTIAQLARSGELVRQNGPDAWLPEAGGFVHRMSHLIAQGLGFGRCRSLCLRGTNAVLTVAEAGAKVMAVSGPVASMTNVLRRAGLE